MPSANARGGVKTPPYGLTHPRVPGPYNAYVNYIRRAGCPHPAASSRGYPSTGSHPRRERRPRRPGNLPSPPTPGETLGPGMPGPYRAVAGKPPAVRKRPRGGSRPLPTDRPINECPPPYRAYVNYIRRAGCPHPAASSRSYPSTGSHPRRGRRPRRPGNLLPPPIPGKTSGPGMPGPYRAAAGKPHAVRKRPRRGQDPSLRTAPSTSARPPPQVRAATRQRAATHVGGGVPDAPETSRRRPSPGKPPGRACPPLPRGGGQAPCRPQTPAEGSRPLPTD